MVDYLERQGGPSAVGLPSVLPSWSLGSHLDFMDTWNITSSVVSLTSPALSFGDVSDRRKVAQEVNEYFAGQLIGERPTRFGAFAALPLPDVPGAIAAATYALDTLGLDGVGMLTNYFGKYLGEPEFRPLLEVLDAREAVVFLHPNTVVPVPEVVGPPGGFGQWTFEYPFDTTRAVASLIYTGTLDAYPNIRWILCHAGGAVPYLSFRLATLHAFDPRLNEIAPAGPLSYLKRFYFETAQAFGKAPLSALREVVEPEQILFGSDYYPVAKLYSPENSDLVSLPRDELPHDGDPAPQLKSLFTADQQDLIHRENALDLFPRLAARRGENPSRALAGVALSTVPQTRRTP
ncbi:amidohydrolase [Pseudarthrobacter sp. MDT3-9]|nr:amidohydrolase [Pseudarthrobacter sp. MDT3-9]